MGDLTLKKGGGSVSVPLSGLSFGHSVQGQAKPVSIRCPHCGNLGFFAPTPQGDYAMTVKAEQPFAVGLWLGVRFCPGPQCKAPVFMVAEADQALTTLPPRTIDFDRANLPARVLESLAEAITCHSVGAYRASALMIRRTLEEVCLDREATGKDLQKRLADLRSKITLPQALFDAMDRLRLLGNDAAHIEAKTYDEVGEEETSVGIELTKEIVKAAYQYEHLLGRLNALGKA